MFEILTYALAKSKATKEVKEAVSSKLDKPANPTIGQILRVKSITDDGDIVLETVAGGGGNGLPDGGTAGQALVKKTDDSFDVEWKLPYKVIMSNQPFNKAELVELFNNNTLIYVYNVETSHLYNIYAVSHGILYGVSELSVNTATKLISPYKCQVVNDNKINFIYDGIYGIPNGGTTNQILSKKSNTDGDMQWIDPQTATVRTAMDDVAVAGAKYFLGEQAELSITMPTDAKTGQEIMVVFSSGATPCTLSIDLDDFDYVPKANTTCKITFTCIAADTWLVDVKEG